MKKRGRFKFSPGLAFIDFVQLCHTFETIAKFCCYNNNNNNNNNNNDNNNNNNNNNNNDNNNNNNYYYYYNVGIIVPVSVDMQSILYLQISYHIDLFN